MTPARTSRPIRFPAVLPTLSDEVVCLRELGEDDIPAWFARATDVESAGLAGDPVPESIAAGATWLQKHRDLFLRKAGLRWAIVPVGSPGSEGTVGLTIAPRVEHHGHLALVVARRSWGKGIGTAAARLAIRYAFTTIGLTEVHAEVLERNPASIRLLEKIGFRRVGVKPPTATEPEELLLYALSLGSTSAT